VTKGGDQGTSGARGQASRLRDPRWIAALAFVPFGLLYMAVNAASLIDQRRALGLPIAAWEAWTLEGTSLAAWLLLLPLVLGLAVCLLPRPPWQAVLGHLAGFIAVSCTHTVLMAALRGIAFGLAGQDYAPAEPWSDRLLFEARKDAITYVSILVVFLLARRLVTSPSAPASPLPSEAAATIEVRDGSRVVMLRASEIDWVGAAGNYVELHGAFGSELARRTMANIEQELTPHGFVRIHRSRLVRREAIEATRTRQSGDFDITLRSGTVIAGSRRYRRNLG
jgi:hypothetical protein